MTLLILGMILWWGAHLIRRMTPGFRTNLTERFGDASRGIVAGGIFLGLLLMIFGYRGSDFIPVYTPASWATHLNNLLMICAVILMGAGSSKGRARTWLRHPMLTGAAVWSVAHLLVNGDLASLILFGGIGLWALFQMRVINAAEGPWERPVPGPIQGDIKLLVISAVVFVVIVGIHSLVGPSPFPG